MFKNTYTSMYIYYILDCLDIILERKCPSPVFWKSHFQFQTSTGIRTTSTGELGEKRTQVRLLWGFSAFQTRAPWSKQHFSRCKSNGIFQVVNFESTI